jgi:hypothetical protein
MMARAAEIRPEHSWKTAAGEGTLEMAHRIIPGFLKLMSAHGVEAGHGGYLLNDARDEQRIALVAHGGSLGVLTAFLLGIPIRPYAPIAYQQTDTAGVEVFRIADPVHPENPANEWPYPRPGKKNATVKLGIVPTSGGDTTWVKWDAGAYPYLATVKWPKNAPLTILVQNRTQTEELLLAVDEKTGELTGLDIHFDEKRGKFYDLDLYGQLNFTRSFAAQLGYRRLDVEYRWDGEQGDFLMEGLYFGGTARF